jgi:hypothetical protein
MARGFPVEGERGPYVGDVVVPVPTCQPDELVRHVAGRVEPPPEPPAAVAVVTANGAAIGRVDSKSLKDADREATMLDVMEIVPDTVRPSVLLAKVDERVSGRFVTNPEGVLLGMVDPDADLPPAAS